MDKIFKLLTDSLLNCTNHEVPHAAEFLSQLTPVYFGALIAATFLSGATIALFVLHFVCIVQFVTGRMRRALILGLAALPACISGGALASLFAPRTWLIVHLVSFLFFSVGVYVVVCLLFSIVDGKHSAVKRMTNSKSHIRLTTPPFCCLCPRLPKPAVQLRRIRFLEFMVLQCPVVRLVATAASLLFYDNFLLLKIIDFVALPSLLAGIYGCHVLVNTLAKLDEVENFRYLCVFRLVDFFFLVFGVSFPIFEFLARAGAFGCGGSGLSALESAFFWRNFFTVVASLVFSIIATLLLKPSRSAFFDKHHAHSSCRSQSAVSMSTSMSTIETIETTST
ncbi:Organic solute transporter alpha-like protein C18A3.4 family protein [Aphelenchoides fujianensis]|nr:Organic solute transporter alpha-like protein C18A3.4 family protein [Aphelenchoides fujianensis]